jgi:hypothetical protein
MAHSTFRSRLTLAIAAVITSMGAAGATGGQIVVQAGQRGQIMTEMLGAGGTTTPMEVGTGVLVGRVVDSDGSSPVSGAIVTLSLPGHTPIRVLADGQGRFAYRALPDGSFSVSASRPGYVDGAHGRLRPGGTPQPVELTNSQRVGNITVMMWRHAALAGTVVDEHNDPVVGVAVKALRRDYVAGRRRLTDIGADSTDDRGQFRIGSLEPAEYIVVLPMTQRPSLDALLAGARRDMAGAGGGGGAVFAMRVEATASTSISGAPMMITTNLDTGVPSAGATAEGVPLTYQTEFFTAALSASRATGVALLAGEERAGVDFRLTPVPSLSVGGTVTGPDGPAANTQVQLIPADADDLVSPIETATTTTDGTGAFEFTGVPSGQYTLRAQRTPRFAGGPGQMMTITSSGGGGQMQITERMVVETRAGAAPLPTEPTLWAEMNVSLDARALVDLAVPLREGLTVSGQLAFQGAAAQPTPDARSGIGILLEPADGRTAGLTSIARGRVDATGSFTTIGVPAGKYILRVTGAPQGWTLRSAVFAGRDITETAVELKDESAAGVFLSFTDRPTELSGTARDGSGNGDATASILVFPVEPTAWVDTGTQPRRLLQARTGRDGSFRLGGLPPGEYHVVAIAGTAARSWQDPQYLDAVSRSATQVRIGEGETRAVTLSSTKGPA